MKSRIEKDSLGTKEIPRDAYYGIHTARSLENFPISGFKAHPRFVEAFVLIKKAAALANTELGLLEKNVGQAIVRACDEVLTGKLGDQFVVDVFQMGAGTSFNMNVNEVLAARANEILGGTRSQSEKVNPNDHVNCGQSTNDVFPTAIRVASRFLLEDFLKELEALSSTLNNKGREFDGIVKSARTHLQDAVPIRLGQEFSAYGMCMKKALERLKISAQALEELGIGGSAAGTGLNVHPKYVQAVVQHLSRWTGFSFRPAADLREAMQSHFSIVDLSSSLKAFALDGIRIANDLRLLSSGPTTGLAEIELPALQAGSSIMPGKVNPSMAEMFDMVCFQVIGNDLAISMAAQAGQLELNVMMPVMAFNILFSLEIAKNACRQFTHLCVRGIRANADRCRFYAERSLALATALNPVLGYAKAAEIVKEAVRSGRTIVELIKEKKLLSPRQLKGVLDLIRMTEPGIPLGNK